MKLTESIVEVCTSALHELADHRHFAHCFRAIADQGGAFHRSGDFAVLDEISLTRREDELPGRDVHLAAVAR